MQIHDKDEKDDPCYMFNNDVDQLLQLYVRLFDDDGNCLVHMPQTSMAADDSDTVTIPTRNLNTELDMIDTPVVNHLIRCRYKPMKNHRSIPVVKLEYGDALFSKP